MTGAKFTELLELPPSGSQLQERALRGEYFLVRNAMQSLGVFDAMYEASLRGIESELGAEVATQIRQQGFEHTHKLIGPGDIPRVTDASYREVTAIAPSLLQQIVPRLFGHADAFYYERLPNVRFHIPFDSAAPFRKQYSDFTKKRGDGKITAHGPHRDSWLECPTNCVNVWVALGPVEEGNGLTVYPEVYGDDIARDGCHIRKEAGPGIPSVFKMNPGDAVVFHGDQVHGSVLNYTDLTRHVISFRLCLSKPEYRDLQIHDYVLSSWAVGPLRSGPLSRVAELPAKLTPNYFMTRAWQLGRKLGLAKPRDNTDPVPTGSEPDAPIELRASDLPAGALRAVDKKTCVARLADGQLVAFDRRCTHEGADLALGHIDGQQVRCPWHHVPFDLATGKSPCEALRPIKLQGVDVDPAGLVRVRPS